MELSCALGFFNLDLRKVLTKSSIFCNLQRNTCGGCFREIVAKWSASLEFQAIIEQLDILQGISRQVVEEFNDVSRSIDDIKIYH